VYKQRYIKYRTFTFFKDISKDTIKSLAADLKTFGHKVVVG